jgi:hypothetical protein
MAPRLASFWQIVDGVIAARLGNPGKTQRWNLPVDREAVANEVDLQWATYCHAHKYFDYIDGTPEQRGPGTARPFPPPPPGPAMAGAARPSLGQSVRNVAAGVETIVDWIKSKEEAVPHEQAEKRAAVCAACKLNEKGEWTSWFTVSAARAIRAELEKARGWNLTTSRDAELGTCAACSCVNRLSVHCPLEPKLRHMPAEAHDALDPQCWLLSEEKALSK